jgi:hypothetical protein
MFGASVPPLRAMRHAEAERIAYLTEQQQAKLLTALQRMGGSCDGSIVRDRTPNTESTSPRLALRGLATERAGRRTCR